MSKKLVAFLACAYALAAFAISRIPLFDYLGYEFSASFTFFVALFSAVVTFSVLRNGKKTSQSYVPKEFLRALRRSVAYHGALLAVPLLVISLNAFAVKNCSYLEGFLFYLLFPCVTLVFCTALMGCCWVIFRRARLTYFILVAIILIHSAIIGYATPQIYSYNVIYGFFPGFSYDEVLSISPTLIFFRFISLLAALFLTLCALSFLPLPVNSDDPLRKTPENPIVARRAASAMAIILGTALGVLWLMRTSLGLESSAGHIQQVLGSKYRTEHFTIFYSAVSFTEEEIRRVAAEHEFRFHQVEAALQSSFAGTVESYIYPTAEVKRVYIGTGTTNIAKPWRREIHLNKDSWEGTLKHELVHVLAGEFGMPIIRAHYHTGLVEGLATAIDNEYGNRTLHEYAAAILKFGFVKNPEHLISPLGFALQPSSVSYVLMGSFCRYLLDRYGVLRFKELYGGRQAEEVFGRSYDQLVEEWQHALLRIDVPEQSRQHVAFYFNRQSIFARQCARAVAKLNQDGWNKLSNNASVLAMETFSQSLQKSWNTEGLAGLARSAYQAARYDSVVHLLGRELQDSVRQSASVSQLLIFGDALWYTGDTDSARRAYERLLLLDLSDGYNEAACLRLEALSTSIFRKELLRFFVGSLSDSAALDMLQRLDHRFHHPLFPYLRVKLLFRHAKYREAISELDSIHVSFTTNVLEAAKRQLLGAAHFRLNEFQLARKYFWESLNYASSQAAQMKIDDWLERCQWYESWAGH